MFRDDFLNLIYESKFSYSNFGEIVTKKNFLVAKLGCWLQAVKSPAVIFNGYIDVDDGCWRRNVLVATLRCNGFDHFGH